MGRFGEHWKLQGRGGVIWPQGHGPEIRVDAAMPDGQSGRVYYERIVACVNALEGYDPAKVRFLLDKLNDDLREFSSLKCYFKWADEARDCREGE